MIGRKVYIMKKAALFLTALVMTLSFSACGPLEEEPKSADSKESNAASVTDVTTKAAQTTTAADTSEIEKIPARAKIGENGAKAVTEAILYPKDGGDISGDVYFEDLYGRHVLHSEVVGLVGAPVEVDFDSDKVKGGTLVFVYDPDELKGVRPDALMFLWYDEENDNYLELESKLNAEEHTVSVDIKDPGCYMLVNLYEWLNVWGANLDDNGLEPGYDPSQEQISSNLWGLHGYVGDIPSLADEDYINSCRQDDGSYLFNVSTPGQLASAVYCNNCDNKDGEHIVRINIEKDIDLDGFNWAPMGWTAAGIDYDFTGAVIGNGHTIKNMHIDCFGYAGFIGNGKYCMVSDLNFENAHVKGRNPGIVISYARGCGVSGCTVQGEVKGYEAGSVVGIDQNSYIENCKAKVICDGEDIGKYLSGTERGKAAAAEKNGITEKIWLDDNSRPCREEDVIETYDNLGWEIKRNGIVILNRNAYDETTLPWQEIDRLTVSGHYEVTLVVFVDGYYIPVSNTVEYDVK